MCIPVPTRLGRSEILLQKKTFRSRALNIRNGKAEVLLAYEKVEGSHITRKHEIWYLRNECRSSSSRPLITHLIRPIYEQGKGGG